jgi:hypothetical protein
VTLGEHDLDGISTAAYQAWLMDDLRKQIGFMRAAVPYWSLCLSSARVDEEKIESLADLATLPIFTKADLRALPPMELVAKEAYADIAVGRWTSGTTGRPTASFWTQSDWAGLISSTARMLGRHQPIAAPMVFNAYSQAHITGPVYHAALQHSSCRHEQSAARVSGLMRCSIKNPASLNGTTCAGGSVQAVLLALRLSNKRGRTASLRSATSTALPSLLCSQFPALFIQMTSTSLTDTSWSRS